jgi:hypothetical protein
VEQSQRGGSDSSLIGADRGSDMELSVVAWRCGTSLHREPMSNKFSHRSCIAVEVAGEIYEG